MSAESSIHHYEPHGFRYTADSAHGWEIFACSDDIARLFGTRTVNKTKKEILWSQFLSSDVVSAVRSAITESIRLHKCFQISYPAALSETQLVVVCHYGVTQIVDSKIVHEGFICLAQQVCGFPHQQSEKRYEGFFNKTSLGIFQTTRDGRYLAANQALATLYGYDQAADLIADLQQLLQRLYVKPNRRQEFMKLIEETGEIHSFESEVYRKDGSTIWISENAHTVLSDTGKFVCYEGTVENITDRKKAVDKLSLMATVFSNSNEAIIITDKNNKIVATNSAFRKLSGYTNDEVIGRNPRILSAGVTPAEVYRDMWDSLDRLGEWQGELWDKRKSGEAYPKLLSISVVRDSNTSTVTNYIGSFIDISSLKATEERIRYIAHHDALTSLPNRISLEQDLTTALEQCQKSNLKLALMLIDLDRFKAINDTLGHHAGDELLVEVSQRLKHATRSSDIVARLGGDEFVVALPAISAPIVASQVAEKIVHLISTPVQLKSSEQHTSPSIGISIFPDDAESITDLLKNADIAMYHAKSKGRGNYQFFTAELNQQAQKRLLIERDLRTAIRQNEFVVHYQPKVDLNSMRVAGFEALLRWNHPIRGMVPPSDFIPIAEDIGAITDIGEWVLEEACSKLQQLSTAGYGHLNVSVNLSPRQFQDAYLPAKIESLVKQYQISPHCLELEITESCAMASPADSCRVMKVLASIGIQLSIDDFGTGYSSLSHLSTFPIHALKIDKSFVQGAAEAVNMGDICDVSVLLAKKLQLKTVAEGVESLEQLNYLRSIKCDAAQGYLFSKPMPNDFVLPYLDRYTAPI